jgi:hypothetical protein
MYDNLPACRVLRNDKVVSTDLYYVNSSVPDVLELSHNKGTTNTGWTSPSIGSGDVKIMRDCAAKGFTVGIWTDVPSKEPLLIQESEHHIMAYDIECEYFGDSSSSIEAPIICVCVHCSCGFKLCISRVKLVMSSYDYIVAQNNEQMAQRAFDRVGETVWNMDQEQIGIKNNGVPITEIHGLVKNATKGFIIITQEKIPNKQSRTPPIRSHIKWNKSRKRQITAPVFFRNTFDKLFD